MDVDRAGTDVMDERRARDVEPRWPAVLAVVAAVFLLAALPGRVRLAPPWASWLMGLLVLVPMAGVAMTGGRRWTRVQRTGTFVFFVMAAGGNIANLTTLIGAMVYGPSGLGGLQMLTSAIAIWVTNVLAFSLLYWQLDRGGPEARLSPAHPKPDFLFPQDGAPDLVRPGWQPVFADYLFLGFTTATAFSPAESPPLTPRAVLLMMFESSVSLVTIVVVAARAINILGS